MDSVQYYGGGDQKFFCKECSPRKNMIEAKKNARLGLRLKLGEGFIPICWYLRLLMTARRWAPLPQDCPWNSWSVNESNWPRRLQTKTDRLTFTEGNKIFEVLQ